MELGMKRFVSGLLSCVLALSALLTIASTVNAQQPAAPQRIAFINSQAVLKAAPGFAAAESLFTRDVEGFRSEATKLQATLDSAAAAFNRDAVLLSPTVRETRRKELETQQTQLEARVQELQQRGVARERELLEPITTRIQTVIDGVRAEGNYSMIFDVAVLGSGVVSADRGLDLTETVIRRLQAGR
jgi:Skp family chaperone for outer membrane proteins